MATQSPNICSPLIYSNRIFSWAASVSLFLYLCIMLKHKGHPTCTVTQALWQQLGSHLGSQHGSHVLRWQSDKMGEVWNRGLWSFHSSLGPSIWTFT